MQSNPYIFFNGNCEEAFRFYEKCLSGRIEASFPYAGSPNEKEVPENWRDKIMHIRLVAGPVVLMGSDAPPGQYEKPQGFSISLNTRETEEADRVFAALADGGTQIMPIQQTFWARRFGMLVDRFGIPWMVNCE